LLPSFQLDRVVMDIMVRCQDADSASHVAGRHVAERFFGNYARLRVSRRDPPALEEAPCAQRRVDALGLSNDVDMPASASQSKDDVNLGLPFAHTHRDLFGMNRPEGPPLGGGKVQVADNGLMQGVALLPYDLR
jgi:hypothetical protein